MEKLFFTISKNIFDQVTDTFDFVWPTSAALWNLRWQVRGFIEVNPNATVNELEGRFISGSKIHGANIRRAFIDHSWEQQQEQLAKFLLINICALYDAWAGEVLETLHISISKKKNFVIELGQPSNGAKGVLNVINNISTNESDILKNAFYSQLLTHKKNSLHQLDNLLICYRYFKECRNCIVHNNRIADQKTVNAYLQFVAIAKPENFDIKEVPQHILTEIDKPIRLSIRGIVGLSDVVRRMIATIDAELARSESAEFEFLARWKKKIPSKIQLSNDENRKRKQIMSYVLSLGFPSPIRTDQLEQFLIVNNLIG